MWGVFRSQSVNCATIVLILFLILSKHVLIFPAQRGGAFPTVNGTQPSNDLQILFDSRSGFSLMNMGKTPENTRTLPKGDNKMSPMPMAI